MNRRLRALVGASGLTLALALAAWPIEAAAQTTIVADHGTAAALGTTVTQGGTIYSIEGGTLSGANLFHSFSTFSLGTGDTARWVRLGGDAPGVRNVINRVTGGQVSQIAGTLDSTGLANADFFFINPAGIVFSQGARINVPAAAFFSTAAELRFADGARFAVTAPNGSTLSMAAPESFGFLGGQGSIEAKGTGQDFAPSTALLSFSGADVLFSNNKLNLSQRTVVRGLDLIGVGADAQGVDLINPLTATATGSVQMRNTAFVITSGDTAGGAFRIRGGQVDLQSVDVISDTGGLKRGSDVRVAADQLRIFGGSSIGTSARSQGAAGDIDFVAADIDIKGGTLFSVSTTGAAAGRIALTADNLVVRGDATLTSTNSAGGRGGDIAFSAQTLLLEDVTAVSSALGNGQGGDLILEAPSMQLFNTNAIATSLGLARPGDVHIDGDVIEFSGGSYGSLPGANSDSGALSINAASSLYALGASFSASSSSDNGAGSIIIRSPEVLLVKSRISADNFGDGGGGMVLVEADTLVFDEVGVRVEAYGAAGERPGLVRLKANGDLRFFNSDISSNTNGQARGGIIEIAGGDIELNDSRVVSDTVGLAEGDAGRVAIMSEGALLVRNGAVSSGSNSFGNGGDVVLEAKSITLDTRAFIRADTGGVGNAGAVKVTTGSLTLLESASITSQAENATGAAGQVFIQADTITLIDGKISSGTDGMGDAGQVYIKAGKIVLDSERRDLTYISSETLGQGDAGGVFIDAGSLDVRNGAYITSDTRDTGRAGSVTIRADVLALTDGGYVSSDTLGEGRAGDVSVVAGTLTINGNPSDATYISSDSLGAGDAGTLDIQAKSLSVNNSGFISSDAFFGGTAGAISIKADTISLLDFGNIRSRTFSEGRAGDVSIAAGALTLDKAAFISSQATSSSTGRAGKIGIVVTGDMRLGDRALISTASEGAGDAGEIKLRAGSLTVDGGLISSSAEQGSLGASGELFIDADTLTVRKTGSISTVSNNSLRAGRINIRAGTFTLDGGRSLVSSENLAGDIQRGNPAGATGDAGSVLITAANLTVSNGGRITTNSFGAAAGDISISIPRPGLLVIEGADEVGTIQTSSGPGTGGKITITDPLAIVSNGGAILALGQLSGANVDIRSKYFINSTDRLNTVAVDGEVRLETGLYDVSSGTVNREISVLDASKVLQGQCPAARSTGAVSQLITRPVGPHVRQPGFAAPPPRAGPAATGAGACP